MRMPRVAIIGAGVSGLCMAIKLREAGIDSFTVYEKADRVGGTWQANTYPGLYVDVPSRYFQYSFAPSPDWSHLFPPGEEVRRYLEGIVDAYGLCSKIEFGTEITHAEWIDDRWQLAATSGLRAEADFIVTGCGFLHRPLVPELRGLDTFNGPAFHSARWDHSVDLADKRVAVIGTGSTGVQIVTALAGATRTLTQFIRTAQWVIPTPNPSYHAASKWLFRRFPALSRMAYRGYQWLFESLICESLVAPGWQRRMIASMCQANLRSIKDGVLRAKLTPSYEPACKRLVLSSGYYRAVERHGVGIVREPITRIDADAIVTGAGERHPIDVIVLATGFDTEALVRPIEFVGADGRLLSEAWRDGPRGYGTVAVPGLPNLFMTMGPKSPVNVSSMFNVAETQVGYIMQMIERWRRHEIGALTVSEAATDRFEGELARAFHGTIWVTGCKSWYIGGDGTPQIWPWLPKRHRAFLRRPNLGDYQVVSAPDRAIEPRPELSRLGR